MSNRLKKERRIAGVEFARTIDDVNRFLRESNDIQFIVEDKNKPLDIEDIEVEIANVARIQKAVYIFTDEITDADYERLRKIALVRGAA